MLRHKKMAIKLISSASHKHTQNIPSSSYQSGHTPFTASSLDGPAPGTPRALAEPDKGKDATPPKHESPHGEAYETSE